jgi:hypothetical protein
MRDEPGRFVILIAVAATLLAAASAIVFVALARMVPRTCEVVEGPPELAVVPGVPIVGSVLQTPPAPAPTAPAPTAPPPVGDVELLFSAGAHTYVALQHIEPPEVDRFRLVEEGPVLISLADVPSRLVPADARTWQRAGVLVDGDCFARISGFAVIARLRGDARAAIDAGTAWTADTVVQYGNPMLAARIVGCEGTFARKATHAAIDIFGDGGDESFGDEARELFLASNLVADAQREWEAAGHKGRWYEATDALLETRVLSDPRSDETWVMIHAYRDQECGQLGGNVVGLYRVGVDRRGRPEVIPVQLRAGGGARIVRLIDLERDGMPELVTAGRWNASIERAGGESVISLDVVEYGDGCGC